MKPLKDIPTPENALLSNSVLYEIMLDRKYKSYRTDLIEYPKGLWFEVLGVQFNFEELESSAQYSDEVYGGYEAFIEDLDIKIFRAKLGYIILPYFLLVEQVIRRNIKLGENAKSELSNNIIKFLKREESIFISGTDYLIERLRLDNSLPSGRYNQDRRSYKVSLFKEFIVNLIEIAEKEKMKDKEELIAKEIEFRKAKEDQMNSEKMKNYKETGIKETNEERELREQIEKNFKETGIKETDYTRDQRKKEKKEREKNLKETGINETDDDREQREYEEKIQKEEELEEEMIQKYGPVAESLVEDYKSGLIDKNKLEVQLNDMKSKGMLYEEYIYDLLDSIEED